ncbi:hypothetical protein LEP1GSC059_4686 [Leptospira noguchii serovar Panama str. CZ214]|uniref:Uncharacterized protein n=1 Tax=Leptospira noguchii serovar Panama str. CZ214 TaxID=1001595 RepID=T0GT81_9LEPT|nr:hypothetical protein LEP1GSC059_4686 [Leptospira noguchii serovar Panama str. CZ214]
MLLSTITLPTVEEDFRINAYFSSVPTRMSLLLAKSMFF